MKLVKAPTTDVSVILRIVDSTDGTPETGVTSATAGLTVTYRREGAAAVALTTGTTPALSTLSALTDAHTDGGLKHIADGYYRVDVPDAAFAAGADGVVISATATGMVGIGVYVQLTGADMRTELTAAVLGRIDVAVSSVSAGGTGPIAWPYTLTKTDLTPIANANVWVTTDAAGTNKIAAGVTDDDGLVTFYLTAGTKYFWRSKAGYSFQNPDVEQVA